jgi:TRAP-type C4-dicarboxylate transport system permease small subunit
MIIASLAGTHAAVHLVTERVSPALRAAMARVSCFIAGLFFAGLCIGATWLMSDYWNSFEETDVLHIPFRPLRIVVALTAAVLSLIFLHRALRPEERA